MREKLGQGPGPAFAILSTRNINREPTVVYTDGMSKRFYAACAALQSGHCLRPNMEDTIKEAYLMADELLRQEDSE
jgi:hypothetical protein